MWRNAYHYLDGVIGAQNKGLISTSICQSMFLSNQSVIYLLGVSNDL
jgi:hypothetical protein